MSASTSSPVSRGSTPPQAPPGPRRPSPPARRDRKSTRLNSSHSQISYAVFCLKKKKKRLLYREVHGQHSPSRDEPIAGILGSASRADEYFNDNPAFAHSVLADRRLGADSASA